MEEKLFEVAIIWYPTKKEAKAGDKAKLIMGPIAVLAKSPEIVQMQAVKKIPKEFDEQLEQVQIAVRPF